MRIRFTVDITRSDNQSPPWQWATIGAMLPKLVPFFVEMLIPKREEPKREEPNMACMVGGHVFGGGLPCARCGVMPGSGAS